MLSVMRQTEAILLALALLAGPVQAAFKDTLEAPAEMQERAVSLSRFTAVAQAGESLVAVGPLGRIVISKDHGNSWRQVPVPVSSDLVAVRFLDAKLGWAVGYDGVVLQSTDGGATWTKQLDGIQAIGLMQAYYKKRAGSDSPESSKLNEQVQRLVADGADKPFFDVLFLNANEGFVIGAFNMAFRTQDGGKSWVPLIDRTDNPTEVHLYSLAVSNGMLYMAGERGLLRRWDKEHEHFVAVDTPYKGSFFGTLATKSVLIAFGLRGNAVRSPDGGSTWMTLPTGIIAGLTAGTVMPDGRIVLATKDGGLLVGDALGEHFARAKVAKPMPYFGIAPAGPNRVVLVGGNGIRVESVE